MAGDPGHYTWFGFFDHYPANTFTGFKCPLLDPCKLRGAKIFPATTENADDSNLMFCLCCRSRSCVNAVHANS